MAELLDEHPASPAAQVRDVLNTIQQRTDREAKEKQLLLLLRRRCLHAVVRSRRPLSGSMPSAEPLVWQPVNAGSSSFVQKHFRRSAKKHFRCGETSPEFVNQGLTSPSELDPLARR